jgi:DNA polymerase III epsilon subunit-like protein
MSLQSDSGPASPPDYSWFDQAPGHYKTRNQLAELGLKPGGPCVATVTWKRGQRFARLYDEQAALPKRVLTDAQREVLAKAREAADRKARTCYACGGLSDWRLRPRQRCEACVAEAEAKRWRRDRRESALWARRLLDASTPVVLLDTETTSLSGVMVQVSVVALDGTVLLNTLVKPHAEIEPGAQEIHGISSAMVECAPPFAELVDLLGSLLHGRIVVAYNAGFDSDVFQRELGRLYAGQPDIWQRVADWMRRVQWEDAMEPWSAFVGDYSEYWGNYRWQPLGGSHDAAADCLELLRILRLMAADLDTPPEHQSIDHAGAMALVEPVPDDLAVSSDRPLAPLF